MAGLDYIARYSLKKPKITNEQADTKAQLKLR